ARSAVTSRRLSLFGQPVIRQLEAHPGPLAAPLQVQPVFGPIQLFQAAARVLEPDAVAPGTGERCDTGSAVPHFEPKALADPVGRDEHAPTFYLARDAVPHSILHQRLKKEGRNAGGLDSRRDLPASVEPITQSSLLDGEIGLRQPKLLAQRHLLLGLRREY